MAARISVDSLTKGMRKLKFKRYKFKKASKGCSQQLIRFFLNLPARFWNQFSLETKIYDDIQTHD